MSVTEESMTMNATWIAELRWNNPYTQPPLGLPICLASMAVDSPVLTKEQWQQLVANYSDYKIGCGYSLHLQPPEKPIKRWSEAQKQKARLTRQKNTIKKKWPLFEDEFTQDLNAKG